MQQDLGRHALERRLEAEAGPQVAEPGRGGRVSGLGRVGQAGVVDERAQERRAELMRRRGMRLHDALARRRGRGRGRVIHAGGGSGAATRCCRRGRDACVAVARAGGRGGTETCLEGEDMASRTAEAAG